MTYSELGEWINKMTPEHKCDDVTIYDVFQDEYYPITDVDEIVGNDGVLEHGCGVLILDSDDPELCDDEG